MHRRTATCLVSLTAIVTLALAGCTPSAPNATSTDTPAASATPTPTLEPTTPPTPAADDQASTSDDAIAQATKAAQRYFDASFTMMSTPGLDASYLSGLLVPGSPMVKQAEGTVATGYRLKGQPVKWTTNAAMSIAGPLTDGSGAKAPYGSVQLYGCGDNAGTETVDAQGNPLNFAKGTSPAVWTIYFDPQSHIWLIYELKTLVGADGKPVEGSPQC
ncbi:hypothetical protein [Microbacterium testaceum]|uniref:hypothetical protein n=1 Tax=Microbacterium testaceum TaxID=2033 RepID=UPI002AC376FF|nr:hypothetical protein [Microbacterium testaceum]MDZ5146338.1 hypothetical protein [Microbacterium testaceum]